MLTPGTPQCLTPTLSNNNKRSNVLLRVPEEMINYAPLDSMKMPKNQKIRQSFSKFLCGNINEQEFVKYKCFPTTYNMSDQVVKKQRNRQEDLTLQIRRQAAIEKARQRWRKLASIVKQNMQLRRELDSYYQTKILNRIELGLKISNQLLQQNIIADDMKNYKLRTMTILKEKKMKQSQSCFIPPKHYHFLLQEQFREQSDEYLFIYHKNLPNTKTLSDKQYKILLDTYLNKKKLFEQYQEEQKLRRIVKWKQSNNVSTFYSSNMSCQSNGLNKEKPMQRLSNPLSSQQGQRNHELKLINQISETENPKLTIQTRTKKYLRQSHIKQKQEGVVKHNRIQSMDLGQSEIDDGLDMSNASITEALLDQLYLGSQKLQEKLRSQTAVQKKVRDILRLQEMKVNTIYANYSKLNKYQQKQK